MLRLALRTLRLRKGGFLATFVAVFFGALLVSACGGLMETGIRTAIAPQRLAAAPIVVTGQQDVAIPVDDPADEDSKKKSHTKNATLPESVRLDAGLAGRLRAVPGVTDVVPELNFPAVVGDKEALGHAWDSAVLTPFTLTAGTAPQPGEVVVDAGFARAAGLSVGAKLDVAAQGTSAGYRIAGIAAAPHSMPAQLFFTASDAERLAGHPGRVDDFGVFTSDTSGVAPRISAVAGAGAAVVTGEDRGAVEFPGAESSGDNLIVLAAVSGGLSLLVAIFVVAGTLTLSVQQRQRELALLRAIGTTPRQLRRMVLGEAAVVGVLATATAAFLGPMLGRWLFGRLAEAGMVPAAVEFHEGWIPAVTAIGSALLVVLLAALVAGRRAGRVRPVEALAEAAVERSWVTPLRVVLAVLCFGGGTALAIVTVAVMTGPVAASTAGPAVMLWAFGLAAISPGVTKLTAVLLRGPVRLMTGVAGRVALSNTRVAAVRAAGAVTPIMLAVGIATANIYLQTTQEAESARAFSDELRADAVVSAPSGVALGELDRVRDVPGVGAVSAYVTSTVFVTAPFESDQDEEGYPALGLTAPGAAGTTAVSITSGSLDALSGNTVVLPGKIADDIGRHVGDQVTLRLGDGASVDVRVAGIAAQRPGFERILLPADLLAAHTTLGLAPQLLVAAAPGVDAATLTARLSAATAGQPVHVGDRGTLIAAHAKQNQTGAWVNYLLVGMIMAYTVISVVNTLVAATGRRRREFGLQRLSGFTRAQVLRMAGVEGGLTAAIGVLLGTLTAAGAIVPFCLVASDSLLPDGSPSIYLVVVGLAVVLALTATLVPTWAATRTRPVDAVSLGE